MKRNRTFQVITTAMLSAIAYLLMMFDFPLPGFPVFLKIDFSEIPVLLGAIVFGPVAAIVIEALKNFLYYAIQGSLTGFPIGELANFIAGLLLVLPAAFIARKVGSRKNLIFSLVVGILLMAVVMSVLNYFVILPVYMWFLHFPHMSAAAMFKLVAYGILPFNLIKGAALAVIFLLIYPRLKPIFRRFSAGNRNLAG
ncbi:MAG TPA: ECF transporter S component [Bacillales bacterium]|nr:ECF transporter S component [Bacillales bacterium]